MRRFGMIGMACLMAACQSHRMNIEGYIETPEKKIYLGEMTNEYYGYFKAIDSAEILDGKFAFRVDDVKPQMLFLGFRPGKGGMLMAEAGNLTVKGQAYGQEVRWEVAGSELNRKYATFLEEKYVAENRRMCDSLNQLFYAARDKDDRQEMKRIKDLSIPVYEEGEKAASLLTRRWVEQNKDNVLGIYLYYSRLFNRKNFPEIKDVEAERAYLNGFGRRALQSVYWQKIAKRLDLYAGCAIGAVAPEICGRDTLGNPLKLSDFRGKYVLVDFWDSYCHWCREETPWLRKALEVFKDKNFTILGVSDDRKEELWLRAIREDGSNWNHLLLSPKDSVMTTYCIKGIPHIILVAPDGKILAKDLRHEKLTTVPMTFISQ